MKSYNSDMAELSCDTIGKWKRQPLEFLQE